MAKKNTKKTRNVKIIDVVNWIFITAIFGVYPIVTHNAYFDITLTRYRFFIISAVSYIALYLVAYFIDNTLDSYYEIKTSDNIIDTKIKRYFLPEFWIEAFMLANVFAFIVADDKKDALTGETGRYMGLTMYIIICVMFLLMSARVKINLKMFVVLAASSGFAYIVAIFQRLGNDFMNYRDGMTKEQFHKFTSTMGNINVLSSFLLIVIPLFMTMFIFTKVKIHKIISGIITVGSGMMLIICNSDSAYLGMTAVAIFLLVISIYKSSFKQYLFSIVLLALGNLFVVILNRMENASYEMRGGVAEALDRVDLGVIILIFSLILYVGAELIDKKYGERLSNVEKKKFVVVSMSCILVCVIIVVVVGVVQKWSIFVFDYNWGTYRGYVWSKCGELFADAPVVNKLFGYGNESLKSLMVSNYYDEMIAVTDRVYDNAHNELLQYLLTTGIVGLVTYIGLFVSSFVFILKNSRKSVVAYMCLSAMVGYFTQAIININQPITTPFLFVIMAIGIGVARYNQKEGVTVE